MRLILLLFLLVIGLHGVAQNASSDTLIPYKKAAILSACLPGLGQVYNSAHTTGRKNAYWKVPLFIAGLGATSYFLVQNQQVVTSIKTEYTQRMNGGVTNPVWADYDNLALVSLYDQYARMRDLSILGVGAVYVYQIIDAAVEAHFLTFDVSKDLTITFSPLRFSANAYGLSARFKFNNLRR